MGRSRGGSYSRNSFTVKTPALEAPDKQCPRCGGALAEMEGCYEEAEAVDVMQRRFVLKRHKYRCDCGGCVETALGSPKLQPGGRSREDFWMAESSAQTVQGLRAQGVIV